MSNEQNSRGRYFTNWFAFRNGSVVTAEQPHKRSSLSRRRIVFWCCALVASIGVGFYVRAEIHRRVARFDGYPTPNLARSGGTLIIAGGGELPFGVRQRFIELAGANEARIVVIPAMNVDANSREQYREMWLGFGAKTVDVLSADSRAEADQPAFSTVLESATGVWLGGGQQTWFSGLYGRTLVQQRLKEVLARNGVIGGTSAGAAVMSDVMIAGGRGRPIIGKGFDLIPDAVIDQHFIKRNRIRRLQSVLEEHPNLVGFGVDEGTALIYGVESGTFRVMGQSCVVALVPQTHPDQATSFRMEFFNPGDEFDVERLRRGDPIPPNYVDMDTLLLGD